VAKAAVAAEAHAKAAFNKSKVAATPKTLDQWLKTNTPKDAELTDNDRIFLQGFNSNVTSIKRARIKGVLYRTADADTAHTQSCGVRINCGPNEPKGYGRILKMFTWKVFQSEDSDLTVNIVGVEWVTQTSVHADEKTGTLLGTVNMQSNSNKFYRMQLAETVEPFNVLFVPKSHAKSKTYDILVLPRGWKTEYTRYQ